jgi:hypothetical protein
VDLVDKIMNDEIPLCESCGSLVKPDIVFFGEQLPIRFFEKANMVLLTLDNASTFFLDTTLPRISMSVTCCLSWGRPSKCIRLVDF